jgi:hypothetical protein
VLRQRQLGVCCICDNRITRRYTHAMLNRKIPVCKDSICLLSWLYSQSRYQHLCGLYCE